jgi:CubicO group peptidase (beta-lactamase class C family)
MKNLLLLIFALALLHIAFAQKNDPRIVALEPQLEQLLSDWKVAGFAVAVVEKDKVIYSKGFGFRDAENKLPVTPNTLFAIGSSTKPFTSSLIGLLEKDKLVDLDKPVRTYFPTLTFFNDAMTDLISLRDMMSHRTGVARHDFSWYMFTSSSRDSLMRRIAYLEPFTDVGKTWEYNNFMFLVQGMVAEKITGYSWEQNIREKFFQPLGMSRSSFSASGLSNDQEAAVGYTVKNDSIISKLPYYKIDAMGPAGGINSTVLELSNWVMTWINGGKFKGKEILPERYIRSAISSQILISPALPTRQSPDVFFSSYGLGWFLQSYRGHYRVSHPGNIDGFSANVSFFPTDSVGIIVLSNQHISEVPALVQNMIADRVFQLPVRDWNGQRKKNLQAMRAWEAEAKKTAPVLRKSETTPSHSLKDYEGSYLNPGYGTMEVFFANDSLFLRIVNRTFWLRHYNYDVFEPVEREPVAGTAPQPFKLQFQMSVNGDIRSVSAGLEPTLKPLEFFKRKTN